MQVTTTIFLAIIRFTGIAQIVLGGLFWFGYARNQIPVHMLLGIILVLALWGLAVMAAWARRQAALAGVTLLWGAAVIWLGLNQARLLPGDAHWVIQLLHLLAGLGAMGLGERLAAGLQRREAVTSGAGRGPR